MRIGISTGGGDAPGLNAVIRSAVLTGLRRGWEVLGIRRGFGGFLQEDQVVPLRRRTTPTTAPTVDKTTAILPEIPRSGTDQTPTRNPYERTAHAAG